MYAIKKRFEEYKKEKKKSVIYLVLRFPTMNLSKEFKCQFISLRRPFFYSSEVRMSPFFLPKQYESYKKLDCNCTLCPNQNCTFIFIEWAIS